MSDFQKLKTLTAREWGALLQALILLPLIRMGLAASSFNRVLKALGKTAPIEDAHPEQSTADLLVRADIAAIIRMVNVAANNGPVRAKCLPRSLATWWLLRRQGIDCEVRIGVLSRDASIHAHAWVEYRGQVLNDAPGTVEEYFAFERVTVDRGKQGI